MDVSMMLIHSSASKHSDTGMRQCAHASWLVTARLDAPAVEWHAAAAWNLERVGSLAAASAARAGATKVWLMVLAPPGAAPPAGFLPKRGFQLKLRRALHVRGLHARRSPCMVGPPAPHGPTQQAGRAGGHTPGMRGACLFGGRPLRRALEPRRRGRVRCMRRRRCARSCPCCKQ